MGLIFIFGRNGEVVTEREYRLICTKLANYLANTFYFTSYQ